MTDCIEWWYSLSDEDRIELDRRIYELEIDGYTEESAIQLIYEETIEEKGTDWI